ncbi:zinc finger protein OZF-like isoform X1 [Diorhabda carinulata]|uniref:zinc finger protein OZF-like isoform X1 n=1 Tax=Diorhabda carinulata TaxID=1163345 RepID=UPI0025A0872C|nr:zinc finger protein OZF-like isoform X1 [Diorhabda carinulata]
MFSVEKCVKDLDKIDLSNSCRMCITGKNYLKDIYTAKLTKMIESCFSFKISEDDGLPSKICTICIRTIVKLHAFKKKVERNDTILKQIFDNRVNHIETENSTLESDLFLKNNDNSVSKSEENIQRENKGYEIMEIPPLIPISRKTDESIDVSRDLPLDAPPLIPIKPIENIKTLDTIVLECYNCNKKFQNVSDLKQHNLVLCKPKDLQCTICLKTFNERKKLIGHLKGHMVIKNHVCNYCNKKYPNESTLRVHIRSHTGEKPFKCQICDKGFVRWAGVRLHMKTHEDTRPFLCEICNKSFKIHSNLERHKRIHFGIKPYSCTYCDKVYRQLENLTLHIRTSHTNDRPFLCNICGKAYVNSTRLNRHMGIHSGWKPHKCRTCPKAYTNRADLRIHESYHSGKNVNELKKYSCRVCNMRFFHPSRLEKHFKIHNKEMEQDGAKVTQNIML